jgi:Nickel-dependent hydrogenase
VIKDAKIKNYQAVVPSTWNASPRDRNGAYGPYEASLLHTPLAKPEEPLEVLRTVHSFDPCMACACHAFERSRKKIGVTEDSVKTALICGIGSKGGRTVPSKILTLPSSYSNFRITISGFDPSRSGGPQVPAPDDVYACIFPMRLKP